MDPDERSHWERSAAMREVIEIWHTQLSTSQALRVELMESDAIRKLSGRLRRGGAASLVHALARQSQRGTPTPESWLECYDRMYHPTSRNQRRGISDDDVPLRQSGSTPPPTGGIAPSSLG